MKLLLGWRQKKLGFGPHVSEGLILVSGTDSVVLSNDNYANEVSEKL